MAHTHSSTHDNHQPALSGVEPDHVDIKAVFGFGIGLAVIAAIIHFLMLWMWSVEVAHIDASNPPRVYPLAVLQDERQPPEPRLQTNPKQDLKDLRAEEDKVLTNYSWVDRNNGIVRIPVSEAMKLTLQRGLPARQQQASPAAAGSQGTQAAPSNQATQEKK